MSGPKATASPVAVATPNEQVTCESTWVELLDGPRGFSAIRAASPAVGAREQQEELLPAEPVEQLEGPQVLTQRVGDVAQHGVAHGVSVFIVDVLKRSMSSATRLIGWRVSAACSATSAKRGSSPRRFSSPVSWSSVLSARWRTSEATSGLRYAAKHRTSASGTTIDSGWAAT